MAKSDVAKLIGERCRRVRMARGLSQAELAEKVFTGPANLSKLEKQGISDIDMIKALSEALGYDLLTDEQEQEGSVGEVGKEILRLLILHEGYLNFDGLLSGKLYSLSKSRITDEIFKLEKIGLIYREQFVGWADEDRDVVFITAKGIITYKNSINTDRLVKEFDKQTTIYSYEELTGSYVSYQEYIDNNLLEKLIRKLPMPKDDSDLRWYRGDYIQWLKKKYISPFEKEIANLHIYPGESFFCLGNYLMALGFSYEPFICLDVYNEEADSEMLSWIDESIDNRKNNIYEYRKSVQKHFKQFYPELYTEAEYNGDPYEDTIYDFSEEEINFEPYIKTKELIDNLINHPLDILKSRSNEFNGKTPDVWFSDEQVFQYLNDEYIPNNSGNEELNEALMEINRLDASTIDYYIIPDNDFSLKMSEEGDHLTVTLKIEYGVSISSFSDLFEYKGGPHLVTASVEMDGTITFKKVEFEELDDSTIS